MTHLSEKDGHLGMLKHARSKGRLLRSRYGPLFSRESIHTLLQNREIVRHPTRIVFRSTLLQPGEPAHVTEVDTPGDRHFVLAIHPDFRQDRHAIACLAFYQLVRVNYGPYASAEHAEALGSEAMGMTEQDYYECMCQLADRLTVTA